MRNFLTVAASMAFLSCGAPFAQGDEPDARALYDQHCAQCHGADLRGGNAQSMLNGVWQFGDSDGYISRNIKHGITEYGMPAYEGTLSDDEIQALTKFIREAEEEAGAEKPGPPERLQTLDYEMGVEIWAKDLEIPWAVDFPDADTALITERPGRLWIVKNGERMATPVSGTPKVLHDGQGGLLDVAVDPDYAETGRIYLAYSHALEEESNRNAPAMTRIVRGRIVDNGWVDQEVLFEADHEHYLGSRVHYGCRIVFGHDGTLYFSIGERGFQQHAQDLSRPNGKVHRIHRDGTVPEDNPFVGKEGALPTIFTYGNRNPQGLAIHPDTGALWETEHGPMGGDEVNLLRAGLNYGWPEITYGRNYNGSPVTEQVAQEGMEQPILYWKPSIAACGLEAYQGEMFPKWHGKLLAGALRFEEVRLLTVHENRVMHSEIILKNYGRVRDVAVDPEGAVYVVLNSPDMILKLTSRGERSYR